MKIIFIIIDGLGDRKIPTLNYKTPLQAAKTPNLDFLAKNGVCGLVLPYLFPGQEVPESDTAHLALFGYNPQNYYLGRGVYEAAGIGIKLKEGDVALRANFATVDKNLKVIDRRAGRIKNTQSLIQALSKIKIKGVKILIKKSYGHRAVLVFWGKNLSAKISNSDPKKIGKKVNKVLPLDQSEQAKFTAQILNQFLEKAHSVLKRCPLNKQRERQGKLPANFLLTRGAGKFKKTPSFKEKYGLKSGYIAGGGLYKGIGKILGMREIKVKGATGFPTTNLKGKFLAAKRALKNFDFIFLHIKAADNLAEDGNFLGKKEFIERIDRNLKSLVNLKQVLIVVTADHSTCSDLRQHCTEPIPILIFGKDKDKVKEFSEKSCKFGKLGKINQLDLMKIILKKSI